MPSKPTSANSESWLFIFCSPDLPKRYIPPATSEETRLGKQVVPVAADILDLNATNVSLIDIDNLASLDIFLRLSIQMHFSKALYQRLRFSRDYAVRFTVVVVVVIRG